MNTSLFDIAIVGSGIACSMTLSQLAERLKNSRNRSQCLRIAIVEREEEMWNGIPYGSRSVTGALTFQRLHEFLEEPERTLFVQWLVANANSWLDTFKERGGLVAAKWLADNQRLMDEGKWGELYLPRFLFGWYVSGQATRAVKDLANAGLGIVTFVRGEATCISRRFPGESHTITVESVGGLQSSLQAKRVVLAVGSPPQRAIHREDSANQSHLHISNLYSPSEDVSMHKIQSALSSVRDKKLANILIMGSNASALELLYLVNYRPEIKELINSIVVLSYSGVLPYRIGEKAIEVELAALRRLEATGQFAASELMDAIRSDIQHAEELQLNIADLRDPVGATVSRLLTLMHVREQERFVCEQGVHFSRLMRRAGRDTRNAADELVECGMLSTVKGEFRRLEPASSGHGAMSAVYKDADRKAEITHPTPFSVTVNCGGFEELDCCSSPLLNSLIRSGLCKVNSTNRGFLVSNRLEASENLYVIGPLVAGNFNDKVRFWHVESASRILGLAKLLAESLVESLFARPQYLLPETIGRPDGVAPGVMPSVV